MNRANCALFAMVLSGVWTPMSWAQEGGNFGWTAKVEIWRHNRLERVRQMQPEALTPFTTDGCSGGMSAAWAALAESFPRFSEVFEAHAPWHECCVIHDQAYHLGGQSGAPERGYTERLAADEVLRQCVLGVADTRSGSLAIQYGATENDVRLAIEFVADRMYDAVRLGGLPCSGLSWRWGYGWPQCF